MSRRHLFAIALCLALGSVSVAQAGRTRSSRYATAGRISPPWTRLAAPMPCRRWPMRPGRWPMLIPTPATCWSGEASFWPPWRVKSAGWMPGAGQGGSPGAGACHRARPRRSSRFGLCHPRGTVCPGAGWPVAFGDDDTAERMFERAWRFAPRASTSIITMPLSWLTKGVTSRP